MYLDFTNAGQLIVDMQPYIATILSDAPDGMKGTARTPALAHLFEINDDKQAELLSADKAELFHHLTMQLMYLGQRGRPDIRTAFLFLSTQVAKPNVHDWRKLMRVIKYLQATHRLLLTLACDNTGCLQWWVAASYAVHHNMKGHTRAVMSMGQGAALSLSTKQKMVAQSSTEAELIGMYDALPQILWTRHFLEAQSYPVNNIDMYQDNQSAMLLEQNGQASSSKRTKHINIQYFYVKDRIKQQNMRVQHCPTKDMVAYFHTKRLQGALVLKLRDLIMNIQPTSPFHSSHSTGRSVLIQDGAEVHGTHIQPAGQTGGGEKPGVTGSAKKNSENSKRAKSSLLQH